MSPDIALAGCIFLAALLYSSVGHGGASAYLAVMALVGTVPEVMKPAALALNILVSSIAFFRFYRAGGFSARLFAIFAAASVPAAFAGGALALPGPVYQKAVGAALAVAAAQLFRTTNAPPPVEARPVNFPAALAAGGAIGFLSGITGVGGGIFLSPVLLFSGWAGPRLCAGISAAFILANSVAGLLGHLSQTAALPAVPLAVWGVAAVAGGLIGSWLGVRRTSNTAFRRLLAAVLAVAAVKFATM